MWIFFSLHNSIAKLGNCSVTMIWHLIYKVPHTAFPHASRFTLVKIIFSVSPDYSRGGSVIILLFSNKIIIKLSYQRIVSSLNIRVIAAETFCISKLLEIYAWVFTFGKNIEERLTLVNVFLGIYLNIPLENILFLVVKHSLS